MNAKPLKTWFFLVLALLLDTGCQQILRSHSWLAKFAPTNHSPVASALVLATKEDTMLQSSFFAADRDEGDTLFFDIAPGKGPVLGTIEIINDHTGEFRYTPDPNKSGEENFEFRVTDSANKTHFAPVTITITPVDDAPVALESSMTLLEDTPTKGTLVAMDSDSASVTYALATNGSKGTVVIDDAKTGAFTYTPKLNANGPDSFSFVASDGSLASSPAMVSILIVPVNDPPVAARLTFSVAEDTTLSGNFAGSDPEGGSLTFAIVSNARFGVVTLTNAATGAFIFQPNQNFNGADSFTFKVNDGQLDSAPASVAINVTPVNDAPVAHNTSLSVTVNPVSGQLSASDPDGDRLTYTLVSAPTRGQLQGSTFASTGAFIYIPLVSGSGTDSFSFSVSDGVLTSNVATVTINIGVRLFSAMPALPSLVTPSLVLGTNYCVSRMANVPYAGGSGTSEDPYTLCSADQLGAIGQNPQDWNRVFRLETNIDLAAYDASTSEKTFEAAENFSGVFYGQGHEISNSRTDLPQSLELFVVLSGAAQDLRLSNIRLTSE